MKHIGTKIINATPMTRQQYSDLRDLIVSADENPSDDGYLIEYLDGGIANHPDFTGYISWSPNEVFDRAYRPVSAMTFGDALVMLKEGKRVCRAGWNGKGMWLALGHGVASNPSCNFWNKHTRAFAEQNGGSAPVLPYIIMKTADGSILMGWLASQTDMLAEDWMLLEQ